MLEFGRDLWRLFSPTPPLEQVAQEIHHLYMPFAPPPLPFFFFYDDQTFWHNYEKPNQFFKFVLRNPVIPQFLEAPSNFLQQH